MEVDHLEVEKIVYVRSGHRTHHGRVACNVSNKRSARGQRINIGNKKHLNCKALMLNFERTRVRRVRLKLIQSIEKSKPED